MQEDLDDLKIAGAQEDCEALQMDEHACAECEHFLECWSEYPWTEAVRTYESSRGV